VDRDKDQSYVLFGIKPQLLNRMLLPVGAFRKSEIRAMAGELGMRVAEKKDSQEICFVTSGKHAEFIKERNPGTQSAGEIVTTDGTVVGRHDGIERFTIGQRRGIGVAMGEPHFVVRIDADANQIVIGKHEALGRRDLTACRANWLVEVDCEPTRCHAQIRYNSQAVPAMLTKLTDESFRVEFDEPCHGVAPGQAVVCYTDDCVLGGGWIE
jgi:tRNA-specific 2-thiouridylase